MVDADQGYVERLACWTAGIFRLGSIDEDAIRRAVSRLGYVAAFAWLLSLISVASGLLSSLAGMSVLSFVTLTMAGGLLLIARSNAELIEQALDLQEQPVDEPVVAESARAAERVEPVLPATRSFQPDPIAVERRLLSRGEIEGRAYAIYTDGSIEMETAFGQRWFASIDLAHEFIGYRPSQAAPAPAAQPAPFRPATALLN